MKKITVHYQERTVGTLVPYGNGHLFEYDTSFQASGVELSPLALPLEVGRFHCTQEKLSFLPGMMADSLPDAFGANRMMNVFRRTGLMDSEVTSLHKLAYVGNHGMGALTYQPEFEYSFEEEAVSLAQLERESRSTTSLESEKALQHIRRGSSVGGAHPKIVVNFDPISGRMWPDTLPKPGLEYWIIKFPYSSDDERPKIELAYFRIARLAGLQVPRTRSFTSDHPDGLHTHFAIERFDVKEGRRLHYHSYFGLVEGNFGFRQSGAYADRPDYLQLLPLVFNLTGDKQQLYEAFRRCVFNVVMNNDDDHAKNHGFLFADARWELSPAFDLTHYQPDKNLGRGMTVAGKEHSVECPDLLRLAKIAGVAPKLAEGIIEEVLEAVNELPRALAAEGVSEHESALLLAENRSTVERIKKGLIKDPRSSKDSGTETAPKRA